jgi:NADH:ubiquinone oxidoreductase subunit C
MKSPWITTFAGNSGLKKIILNENWSGDEQPLHKEWKHGPYTFYGGITGERC